MKDNDLITRREVELVLLEKGQETGRYKWGEQWELNFSEIREALSEYQSEIVRCKDCKHYMTIHCTCDGCCISEDWFYADGKRVENAQLSSSEIPNS